MSYQEQLPKAIDLSHHLSEVAQARLVSRLRDLNEYFEREGTIDLAGGSPPSALFPIDELAANVYLPNAFSAQSTSVRKPTLTSRLARLFTRRDKLEKIKVPKYARNPEGVNLAAALQYSPSSGLPQLQKIVREFSERVYRPAYSNWTTTVHVGNTDGWMRVVMTLCNPGDAILTDEWTYHFAVAAADSLRIKTIPVPLNGEGMRSDALLEILSTWDERERGAARPRVMYTIPVGQNPTGSTMRAQRKKEIYDICVKFDVIIVEDDPYFFLQEGPYVSREKRSIPVELSNEAFIASLEPSYLRYDYQGRVVRMDSFSKVIAPGCRLGWFTCNPLFAEQFEWHGEVSSQAPCGFGQSIVISLLLNWKFDGHIRWLQGLRAQYRERRDFCVDCFNDSFSLVPRSAGIDCIVYDGYIKSKTTAHPQTEWAEKFADRRKKFPVFTFVPPTSGMFVWLQINFRDHPSFAQLGHKELEVQLCKELAAAGVLIKSGYIFGPNATDIYDDAGPGHVRISFSNSDFALIRKGIDIMAVVLERFFHGGDQV